MSVATRTTLIVSSLFPEDVRDQILQQAEAQANRELKGKIDDDDDDQNNLQSILNDTSGRMNDASGKSRAFRLSTGPQETISILEDAPIANHYPHTTICFADLVGFTKWSSTRAPQDVFQLLETLYGEFDQIAYRRRVFKVETIGDCYVSVVGLPTPNKNHAAVMTRFAWDCLKKSSIVFNILAETLGSDTTALNLRVGIHSGPVTAGVLRGHKGRFQLFGDTMNTASRMETNSRPGSIHCSQETADLLRQKGKSDWLTERPDRIVAKGKGELRTYWVTVKAGGSVMTVDSSEESTIITSERVANITRMLRLSEKEKKIVDC